MMLTALALSLVFLPEPVRTVQAGTEVVTEVLADGTVVERTVRRTETGELKNHGEFQLLRRSSGETVKLVTGEYEAGRKDGRWRYWYPNGDVRAVGTYRRGMRTGKWKFQYAGDYPYAEGSFKGGARSGKWVVWNSDHSPNAAESGKYGVEVGRLPGTPQRYRGQSLDGVMHGNWTFSWANGQTQLEAEYLRGKRVGTWRFWHPEGTYDPEMLSGTYASRGDYSDLDREPLSYDVWEVRAPADLTAEAEESNPTPSKLPDLKPDAALTSKERKAVDLALGIVLTAQTDEERRIAADTIAAHGREVMPQVLNALKGLDLATEEGSRRGGQIETRILRELVGGRSFGWALGFAPETVRSNRMAVLRWYSLFLLTRRVDSFWELDVALPAAGATTFSDLLRPTFEGERLLAPTSVSGPYATRFASRRNLKALGGSGTEQAVQDGLEWLASHQSPDGSWDSDDFMKHCGKIDSDVCEDAGEALSDPGITGLALLGFLGDGNTLTRGPYAHVVRKGVLWLIARQNANTGELPVAIGHARHYYHAIALQALAEALTSTDSARLRQAAQRAVDYAQAVRNPRGAWRYDSPPNGDNDTSVTAWMISALVAAEKAGLAVNPMAIAGGLNFIDEMTDRASGRVGYNALGSMSSRVVGINDHFPPEKAETMTAAGLFSRLLTGQDPSDNAILTKHADLMLKSLPAWDPEKYGCDMYYWYYGSYAMFQMGGRRWKGWNVAMRKAVLESQVQVGDAKGSWDPVGPWGHYGGRVYSTALCVLCLEVYYRYERVLGPR